MPDFHYMVTAVEDGRYKLTRSTGAGHFTCPVFFGRIDLELFFKNEPQSKMDVIWEILDRKGVVEFSVLE